LNDLAEATWRWTEKTVKKTVIEQNGDGLLEHSHPPLGLPLSLLFLLEVGLSPSSFLLLFRVAVPLWHLLLILKGK